MRVCVSPCRLHVGYASQSRQASSCVCVCVCVCALCRQDECIIKECKTIAGYLDKINPAHTHMIELLNECKVWIRELQTDKEVSHEPLAYNKACLHR